MVVIRIWLTLIHVPDHDALGPPRRRPLRRRCRRRRGRCPQAAALCAALVGAGGALGAIGAEGLRQRHVQATGN